MFARQALSEKERSALVLMVCFEAATCLAEVISWSAVSGSAKLSNPAFIMIIEVCGTSTPVGLCAGPIVQAAAH